MTIRHLLLLPLLSLPLAAAAETLVFEGTATRFGGEEVLYQERHQVTGSCQGGRWQPDEQQVEYRREGRPPFATKILSYQGSLLRPEVDFRQPGFDEELVIQADDSELSVEWGMGNGEAERWRIPVTGNLVVDAGFDHFVRANWDALTDGDSVGFSILAPTRGETYDFVAEPAPESLEGADHSFQIRPEGLVMRMLVDPIRLGYNNAGFLTHYAGLGNIRRNSDENHVVAIRYQVIDAPDCPLLPASQQG